MHRIAIIGLTIHGTDVSGLERLRRPAPADVVPFLRDLTDELGASELVYVATCNRVEVIYAREEGELPDPEDGARAARYLANGAGDVPRMDFRAGRDAVQHLFRVASSLDSLVVGEDQILAQVREAYGRSSDIGLVGDLLGPLFHHALAIGKRVRSETDLARHPVSVVNLAVHALIERAEQSDIAIAVVGVGEMGRLLVRALCAADLRPAVIVNRTVERCHALATDCGAQALSLDAFRRGEAPVDVIVTATASPEPVFTEAELAGLARATPSGRQLLGIDLAVPRNLPAVERAPAVKSGTFRVVDLDALRAIADKHRALRAEAALVAEQLVERKVETFTRRFHEDVAAPLVSEVRQAAEEVLQRELAELLSGRLAHLSELDQRAVERWARRTFGRLMHMPTAALKRLAYEMSADDPADVDASEVALGERLP